MILFPKLLCMLVSLLSLSEATKVQQRINKREASPYTDMVEDIFVDRVKIGTPGMLQEYHS